MCKRLLTVLVLIGLAVPSSLLAQDQDSPAVTPTLPQSVILPAPHEGVVTTFIKDQEKLWRGPMNIKRSDVKWLFPLGVGAVALIATDRHVANVAERADGIRPASKFISQFGGAIPLAAASVGTWGVGTMIHNDRAAKTGKMATEAVLHTQLVVQGMKMMFNRERPNKANGDGGFWDGGRSFPSGHAATSFAFATIIANQYKEKKIVPIAAYGLATAISMSRIGGMNHHPSDVLIGAVVGHLIGRYILHRHPAENN